jgi:CRP-like cAMP-binding protein
METLESLLNGHPFMEGLSPEHRQALLECASLVRFHSGQSVFRTGEPANTFYLILSGKVELEIFYLTPGPIPVQCIGPGEVLGWSWLVPPYQWKFDARVLERTEAIQLNAGHLRERCDADPSLGNALLKRFAQVLDERLLATRKQLLENYAARH